MKRLYIFSFGFILSAGSVLGQTNADMEQTLPAMFIGAGSFNNFNGPMSAWSGLIDKTNINFVINMPTICPSEYTNIISNTNLFSPVEQKLLTTLPLQYEVTSTNLPPKNSKFIGMELGSFWLEGFSIGRFQQTNSEAQIKVFFDKHSNGRAAGTTFRTISGDGYDVSFDSRGVIESFRQFKHWQLDGLWADFEGGRCCSWMRFVNGKAVGKWFVWNKAGDLYMEAEFKQPYDFIGHLNFSP